MRWVCPRCGRSINVGLEECPYCPPVPAAGGESPAPAPAEPAAPRVAAAEASEESALRRGFRWGVGFLLAVATILLLLALLLSWLSTQPG